LETISAEIININKLLQDIKNPIEKIEALNHYAEKIRPSNIAQSLLFSEQAIALAEANDFKKGLAYAYWNHGIACRLQARYDDALSSLDKALHLYNNLEDRKGQSRILNSKGNIYLTLLDSEQALYFFNKALELSISSDDKKQTAVIHSNFGLVYQETGDYPKALENYFKSMQIYSEHFNKIPFSLYNNIGIVYENIGDYATALEYYFRSLDACEQENKQIDRAYTLGNIAITYGDLGEYDNSIKYFRESLALIKELGYKQAETNALNNLADAYKKSGLYDKALLLLKQSIQISEENLDKSSKAFSLNLMGEVYLLIGEQKLSKQYFEESLELSKIINDSSNQISSYILLGKLYKSMGNHDAALMSFMNAQQSAEQKNSSNELIEIHREISEIYSLMNKPDKALEHYKRHHKYENEQFDLNVNKRLKTIFIQNEIKTRDKDYQLAVKEKELYKIKNVELVSLNNRLQYLNNEIKEFLSIAVHDLKNPLSGIKAFSKKLYTNFEKYSSDEIKIMAMEMERASIKMFNLIEKLLDVNAIETGNRLYKYTCLDLNDVINITIDDFREKAAVKDINIIFNESKDSYIYADLTSLRQITENLLSNAIKFSPAGKTVYIDLIEVPDNYELHIKDEGPGLTQSDKSKLFGKFPRMSAKPTGGELSTGLGLYIVKKLTESNNGAISCRSSEGNGAEFILSFPIYNTLKIPVEEVESLSA